MQHGSQIFFAKEISLRYSCSATRSTGNPRGSGQKGTGPLSLTLIVRRGNGEYRKQQSASRRFLFRSAAQHSAAQGAAMHPPLVLHRNPLCREQILALTDCHENNRWAKFWGECNEVKQKLDACFRKQKEYKRKVNLAKSRAERERLEQRRQGAGSDEK